jgi:hypothetical protein
MNGNTDPKDSSIPRPQISFTIRPDAEPAPDIVQGIRSLGLPYHDFLLFDETEAGTPGVVRFQFEAAPSAVDRAVAWLETVAGIVSIKPFYGSQGGAA